MAGTRAPLPHIPTGTVLKLSKDDWRYGGHPLLLRVEFIRDDLSGYYDYEWIWISGQQLARDGTGLGHLDALVKVSALSPDPSSEDRTTATDDDRRPAD